MKFSSVSLTVLLGLLPFQAISDVGLIDLHLDVLPRTEEEAARIAAVTAATNDFSEPEKFEMNQAGAATVRPRDTTNAFSQPSANISFERELNFKVGNGLFKKLWVPAPSSTNLRANASADPAKETSNAYFRFPLGSVYRRHPLD